LSSFPVSQEGRLCGSFSRICTHPAVGGPAENWGRQELALVSWLNILHTHPFWKGTEGVQGP
jgi:hypothetical protein